MGKLTFYRQARADGGVRMGLDVDGYGVAHHFNPGADDDDPRLLWFIDLRCEGKKVPKTFEDAMDWLKENAKPIEAEFARLADELTVGIDSDFVPGQQIVRHSPPGSKITIVFSATKRVVAREMGKHLRDFGDDFEEFLEVVKPVHA
jgi:hypothetical protein